ncbi:MAG: hypothetical protein WA705_19605, partial [Candidatus Ozemobacteraceae bacterium]
MTSAPAAITGKRAISGSDVSTGNTKKGIPIREWMNAATTMMATIPETKPKKRLFHGLAASAVADRHINPEAKRLPINTARVTPAPPQPN